MFPAYLILLLCACAIKAHPTMVSDLGFDKFVQIVNNCSLAYNLSVIPVYCTSDGNIVLYNGTVSARDDEELKLFKCMDDAGVWLHMISSYDADDVMGSEGTQYLYDNISVEEHIAAEGLIIPYEYLIPLTL